MPPKSRITNLVVTGFRYHSSGNACNWIYPPDDTTLFFQLLKGKVALCLAGYADEETGMINTSGSLAQQFLSCCLQWTIPTGDNETKICHNLPKRSQISTTDYTILIKPWSEGEVRNCKLPEFALRNRISLRGFLEKQRAFLDKFNTSFTKSRNAVASGLNNGLWIEIQIDKESNEFQESIYTRLHKYARRGRLRAFDSVCQEVGMNKAQLAGASRDHGEESNLKIGDDLITFDGGLNEYDTASFVLSEDGTKGFNLPDDIISEPITSMSEDSSTASTVVNNLDFTGRLPSPTFNVENPSDEPQGILVRLSKIKTELVQLDSEYLQLKEMLEALEEKSNTLKVEQKNLLVRLEESLT